MPFDTIDEAAELYRRGEFVIIVDDEDRENEGDLCIAAEKVTPEAINFMATHGRGLICLALTEERCRDLELPLMVENNTSNYGTAFTVSIEARGRVTTGISARDRAETVRAAIDPKSRSSRPCRTERSSPTARCRCRPASTRRSSASRRRERRSRSRRSRSR